jgi:uncharacterized delta-60 repeat protein
MKGNRRPLLTGLGLWLLLGVGPVATTATDLPARLHPAGTLDTSFSDSTQQPGRVITDFPFPEGRIDEIRGIALQADGKIVAAGRSKIASGDWDFALARYNPDGRIDNSFGDHGRVLTSFGALPDGRRSEDEANAIAIQPDGKIVVGGRSNAPNGDDNFALARYNPDGSLDRSFGDSTRLPGTMLHDFLPPLPDGRHSDEQINALVLQPDGKIVAAGKTNAPTGNDNFALVRYNPNGLVDTEFGHNTLRKGQVISDFLGFRDEIRAIALQPDGKIVVAGRSNAPNGVGPAAPNPAGPGDPEAQRQAIIKLFQELAAQLQFQLVPLADGLGGLTVSGPVWGWEMDKGDYFTLPGFRDVRVLQFPDSDQAAKTLLSYFAPPKPGEPPLPLGVTVTPTKVGDHEGYLVGGAQLSSNNRGPSRAASAYLVWRCENLWLVSEAIVTVNAIHGDAAQTRQQFVTEVQALAATVDQKFTQAGMCQPSQPADWNFALARYNPDGLLDMSFGDNMQLPGQMLTDFRQLPDDRRSDDWANALVIQADGKIIAAGKSNSPNGDDNFALVRYSANGIIDTTFGDNTQQPGRVLTDFRTLPNGSRSTDEITAIALQPEGRLGAGGWSNSPNGEPNFALVRYNPDGIIDLSFSDSTQQPGRFLTDFREIRPNLRSTDVITAIAIQADAKIVAAGYSISPNGENNFALVRYYGTPTIGPLPGSAPTPPQPPEQINLIVTLSAVEVNGGSTVTGTVHLSQPAPAGGLKLVLKSDTPSTASVPETLTVPAGSSSGTFPITTLPVSAVTDVGIFVDFADVLSPRAGNPDDVDLSLRPGTASGTTPGTPPGATTPPTGQPPTGQPPTGQPPTGQPPTGQPIIPLVLLNPPSIQGGMTATGTVMLTSPAPAGGVVVKLESSNPAVATVPASVTIPAGATSATFPVTTRAVTTQTTVRITASVEGANNGIVITVQFLVTP